MWGESLLKATKISLLIIDELVLDGGTPKKLTSARYVSCSLAACCMLAT
jgi:hypothetical protein